MQARGVRGFLINRGGGAGNDLLCKVDNLTPSYR